MADPWWRFYCETITDRKFKYISKMCGLSKLELIGAWAIICTIGHESPDYGALLVTLQLRVTVTDLAEELEISPEITEKMVAAMVDKNMLLIEADGLIRVVNLEKRQYKDIKAAKRQQRHRDTLRVASPVTSPVTPPETETETELIKTPLDEFLARADTWIGCPVGGKSDVDTIVVMVEEYTLDRVKKAATWIKEKKTARTMCAALKAMNTALANGGFREETAGGSNGHKKSGWRGMQGLV